MKGRRLLAWVTAFFIILSPNIDFAEETTILTEARAAILMDRESGRVLFELNADERLPIASTTKIMTALIALENAKLDDIVTAGPNAYGVEGTSIYLQLGEQLTMEQMLWGMMLRSGNDAAVAVAEHIGGSLEAFVQMMNARAAELNADAHFVNPHGLDDAEHLASARGLAKIACAALSNYDFRDIVATKKQTVPWVEHEYNRVLTNKNKILTTVEGGTGVKTGFTKKAGRCLVFSAERDGMELVGVVLNCGDWFDSGKRMLEWGFENYRQEVIGVAGDVMKEIPVSGGDSASVSAVLKDMLIVPMRADEQCELHVELADILTSPVGEGAELGRAWVEIEGQVMAESKVVAANAVGERNFFGALRKLFKLWGLYARE